MERNFTKLIKFALKMLNLRSFEKKAQNAENAKNAFYKIEKKKKGKKFENGKILQKIKEKIEKCASKFYNFEQNFAK